MQLRATNLKSLSALGEHTIMLVSSLLMLIPSIKINNPLDSVRDTLDPVLDLTLFKVFPALNPCLFCWALSHKSTIFYDYSFHPGPSRLSSIRIWGIPRLAHVPRSTSQRLSDCSPVLWLSFGGIHIRTTWDFNMPIMVVISVYEELVVRLPHLLSKILRDRPYKLYCRHPRQFSKLT